MPPRSTTHSSFFFHVSSGGSGSTKNNVESCGKVYGNSTYPPPFGPDTQNGKIVLAPSGCGSNGSVSNVDASYRMFKSCSHSRLCSMKPERKPFAPHSAM